MAANGGIQQMPVASKPFLLKAFPFQSQSLQIRQMGAEESRAICKVVESREEDACLCDLVTKLGLKKVTLVTKVVGEAGGNGDCSKEWRQNIWEACPLLDQQCTLLARFGRNSSENQIWKK